jgi:hypothetical protein
MNNTFITAGAAPSDTNRTDIYECPSNFKGIVKFINVANVNSGNKTAKIEYYDSSATTYYALSGATSIAGEGFTNWIDTTLVLEAGDKVTVTAGTASTIHAVVGVELIYNPLTT